MTPDWAVFGNGGKPILVVWFPVGGNATRLLLYFEDNGAWTLARNEMIDVSPTISPCLSTSSSRLTVLGLGDIPIREFSLLGLRPWRMPVETFLLPIKHLDPQLAIW